MSEPLAEADLAGQLMPIGKVARLLGVSERTLRYYDEIGLVVPSARNPGQRRRYTAADVARVTEVRELQEIMGYSLDEIHTIFRVRERFEGIRAAYHGGGGRAEQARLLEEAATLMDEQRLRVQAKVERLQAILASLEVRLAHCRELQEQITTKSLV